MESHVKIVWPSNVLIISYNIDDKNFWFESSIIYIFIINEMKMYNPCLH